MPGSTDYTWRVLFRVIRPGCKPQLRRFLAARGVARTLEGPLMSVEHLLIRSVGRRCLLADLHSSTDGNGIGYGMMLIRMRRALLVAQLLGAEVFFVRPGRALNQAVMQLRSDEVKIVAHNGARGRWLTLRWIAGAPFRVGAPGLWLQR